MPDDSRGSADSADSADPHEPVAPPPRSRMAMVRRSIWQLVRAGLGRPARPSGNYEEGGPRFAGAWPAETSRKSQESDWLTVVSFNIDHGRAVNEASALFRDEAVLRGADLVLLQEMEEEGTARLADSLGMAFVYYPAGRHPVSGRHFGNAVLVRGAIVGDEKHQLPHLGRVRGTRRIAVAATVEIRGRTLTAFSVHLATILDASIRAQREQLEAVVEVANAVDSPVIIGGDLNRRSLGLVLEHRGFRWLTREVGPTLGPLAVDHLFVRGEDQTAPCNAGVVRDTKGASDHRPVWSTFKLHG
ncbi:MAG: endonuclease/exonuclease/phosphatase family protein [Gemmatimonadaceae bacterium]